MFRALTALALAASLLGGCAARRAPLATVSVEPVAPDRRWRGVAPVTDQAVVGQLKARLVRARTALPRRFARLANAEGALLEPTALPLPALPPGPYHCRLVRLGGKRGVATFDPDICYVGASTDALAFTKQTGSNLPEGYIYEDDGNRAVFLGTFRTAGEAGGAGYGDDKAKDIVGVVERVSSFRWRLILSRAGNGAALDLYELVPVPPEVPGAKLAVPSD